jgi:hypothetical protein
MASPQPSGAELRARIHRRRRQKQQGREAAPNANNSPLNLTLIIHLESISPLLPTGELRPRIMVHQTFCTSTLLVYLLPGTCSVLIRRLALEAS